MQQERLTYLLAQYESNNATSDEVAELYRFIQENEASDLFNATVADLLNKYQPEENAPRLFPRGAIARKAYEVDKVEDYGDAPRIIHRVHFLRRWAWAAASILVLATGAYLWTTSKKNSSSAEAHSAKVDSAKVDIPPGKDGAILTLADGRQVVLDSLGNGVIATQNGAEVVLKDGRLAYDPTGETAGEMVYNTMTTPKGRQFSLLLPDGTRVWLNAASSLRYPTVFAGKERKVEVTGEAYFEVARNTKMPFRVQVNEQAEIQVLGTSFNVNAYENEGSVNTTLLEGSIAVAVSSDRQPESRSDRPAVTLKPGQQAQIVNANGGRSEDATTKRLVGQNLAQRSHWPQANNTQPGIAVINDADLEKVMAWKNGLFDFRGKGLEEVMRQLERWYDIEVVYGKGIPDIRFGGKLSRDASLAGVLKGLKGVGMHFSIEEGRRLVVSP